MPGVKEILLTLSGPKKPLLIRLDRFKSPRTIEHLLRALPLRARGRSLPGNGSIYAAIGVNLKVGVEKRGDLALKRGELAYDPMQDALLLAVEDTTSPSQVNRLGNVENIEDLRPESLPNGLALLLKRA
ncbi:MAG: hypothetical protein Kow0069_22070 [Promethearchaeota archaeon]